MARPYKQTVDYFPHDSDASAGKTLTILQSKYGNDGYAFWFKLLELLARTPGHYYCYQNVEDLEFLYAKTHQKDTETTLNILATLDSLGAIDHDLYQQKIIWCQNFVNRVADAYSRTKGGIPQKPSPSGVNVSKDDQTVDILHTETPQNELNANKNGVNVNNNAQTKLKEKETKEKLNISSSSTPEDTFESYEQNIGELTTDIETELELASKRFTPSWVIDAIREAVKQNKRSWAYVAGILKNWERFGKDAEISKAYSAKWR